MRNLIIATTLLLATATGALAEGPSLLENKILDTNVGGGFTLGEVLFSLCVGSTQQDEQIKELERKVAGMQKQITILHSKKADKAVK